MTKIVNYDIIYVEQKVDNIYHKKGVAIMNHDFSHFYWTHKAVNPPEDIKKVKGADNLYTVMILAKFVKWTLIFLMFVGIFGNLGWNFLWFVGGGVVLFIVVFLKATWPKPNKKPPYHLGSGY